MLTPLLTLNYVYIPYVSFMCKKYQKANRLPSNSLISHSDGPLKLI